MYASHGKNYKYLPNTHQLCSSRFHAVAGGFGSIGQNGTSAYTPTSWESLLFDMIAYMKPKMKNGHFRDFNEETWKIICSDAELNPEMKTDTFNEIQRLIDTKKKQRHIIRRGQYNKNTNKTFTNVNDAKRIPIPLNARIINGVLITKYAIEKNNVFPGSIFAPKTRSKDATTWARPEDPPETSSNVDCPLISVGFIKQTMPNAKMAAEIIDARKAVP